MIYGVNTAVSACVKRIAQLDYVTNNLANVNTPGFKAERLSFVRKADVPELEENAFSHTPSVVTDHSRGTLQKTGNPLDIAIDGEGYFVIQGKEGEYFTRNGSFTINSRKELVTLQGDPVMGEGGKITLSGKNVDISGSGAIRVDGSDAGRLRIVGFQKKDALQRMGQGQFKDAGVAQQAPEERPEVRSGYVELSNVQAVKEMIDMIDIQRSVEAYMKVMQTISEQDRMATGRLGKLY